MQPLFCSADEPQHKDFPGKRQDSFHYTETHILDGILFYMLGITIFILSSRLTQQGKSSEERQLEGKVRAYARNSSGLTSRQNAFFNWLMFKPMLTAHVLTFKYNLGFTKPFSITQSLAYMKKQMQL